MNARELEERETESGAQPRARVVYTEPPIALATVLREEGDGFVVRVRGAERAAVLDASVDPALVRHAIETGARVVLEEMAIVGVLMTSPALTIDREGTVRAEVERIELTAKRDVLIKTAGAFVKLEGKRIEQFATEIHTRGRDVVRFLAAVIRLN